MLNLLIIDDSADDALLVADRVSEAGYDVRVDRVDAEAAMVEAVRARKPDAVICDVKMPHFSAGHALDVYRHEGMDCPFIVISGVVGEEAAVALLKTGAHDFVLKSNLTRLVPALDRELREAEIRRVKERTEQALKDSEARYARACAGANDGIWDWDLARGTVYYSAHWKQILGYGEAEIGSGPEEWLDRVAPEDLAAVRAGLERHLAGESPHFAAEHRIRHRDGDWRWVLARGKAAPGPSGHPVCFAGSLTDVTRRKRTEEDLRQAKTRLESALLARSRFLAAASHDLRQPVQLLVLLAQVLRDQAADTPMAAVAELMEQALDGLRMILTGLLNISRLDAGMVVPKLQPVALGDTLARLGAEYRPQAEAKGLRLRTVGTRSMVRTDPVLLERILRKLIENALRFTPAGGIVLGCRRCGGELRIEVADTGIGIDAQHHEAVFEEFYQVGNLARDRTLGLGLGLSIVQRLADLIGCRIVLRSRPGRGSCFGVVFPTAELPALPAVTVPAAARLCPPG